MKMNTLDNATLSWIKVGVFLLALVPVIKLGCGRLASTRLGANPIEKITRTTGYWTLTFLLITLTVTPLRRLCGWSWLIRLRRMLGLFAFFYGSLHFLTYLVLDQFFDWAAIVKDIVKRPYITVGFPSFLLMIPAGDHLHRPHDTGDWEATAGGCCTVWFTSSRSAASCTIGGW